MQTSLDSENRWGWIDDEQQILPLMTALFVDGLDPKGSNPLNFIEVWQRPQRSISVPKAFQLPLASARKLKLDSAIQYHILPPGEMPRLSSTVNRQSLQVLDVRTLIRGISLHFNNLLMGIWGNASLVRLSLSTGHRIYSRVEQMEKLIHSGAFLIHMVLGYLGERRTIAKRIRLDQMIEEIKSDSPLQESEDFFLAFEEALNWASRIQSPPMVASSTARVFELLLQRIQSNSMNIMKATKDNPKIQKRLLAVDALVTRGLETTKKLRCYAGDCHLRMARTRLAPLLRRTKQHITAHHPQLMLTCDLNATLPMVRVDRTRLQWVLQQLVDNAAKAMPKGGQLSIAVRPLRDEEPSDRCGVHMGHDYLVITIKDSGIGMSRGTQAHIFEPFFTRLRSQSHIGLGLAAAKGIIKLHGGYIQVQSGQGKGSTFKIYLPTGDDRMHRQARIGKPRKVAAR